MLHHAINGKSDERARTALDRARASSAAAAGSSRGRGGGAGGESAHGGATPSSVGRLPTVTESGGPVDAGPGEDDLPFTLDERLPVIQSVLEFAKAKLWMPEVWRVVRAVRANPSLPPSRVSSNLSLPV